MSKKAITSRVASGFLFENRSLVDCQIGYEQKGRNIAGCKWFPMWKWVIGRFSNRRWAKRLLTLNPLCIARSVYRTQAAKSRVASDFQFANGSLVNFQAGDERKGCKIARCDFDDFLNHNSSFENQSLVDFQILSEKSCEPREISSRKFWKSAADGAILKKDCGERSSDEFPKDDSLGYIWSSTESAHRLGCRSGGMLGWGV